MNTEQEPGDSVTDQLEVAAMTSALAAHDDMVGYAQTPLYNALVTQLGSDPRGARVQTWEEIRYASGKRRLDAGEDGGTSGGRGAGSGGRESVAVPGDGGIAPGDDGARGAV